ncbi:MAG: translocation/assembly module TamB domain-containing protein [Paludibacter sp.]|nr:translocation/assembly module TamB domain-containing protein [Paludibacter sp.]
MKKALTIFFISVGSLIALVLLLFGILFFAIQQEGFQNRVKDYALDFLSDKLNTRVELDRISIRFPDKIILKGIVVEDLQNDTLLALNELVVDLDMRRLLDKELVVQHVGLNGLYANVYSTSPDTYNYQFIADAFTSPEPEPEQEDSSGMSLGIDLNTLSFRNVSLHFTDDSLMRAEVHWKSLFLKMGELNMEQQRYAVERIDLKDGRVNLLMPDAVPVTSGFNPGHIRVSRLNTQLSGIRYTPDSIAAVLNSLSFYEQSGLQLTNLSFALEMIPGGLTVRDLLLRTPHTKLQNTTVLQFDSLAQLGSNPEKVNISTHLSKSFVGRRDILLLMPDLALGGGMQLPPQLNADIDFNGTINSFQLALLLDSETAGLKADANMTSLDPDATAGDVRIRDVYFYSDSLNVELDELALVAKAGGQSNSLELTLPFAHMLLEGKYKLTQLGNVVSNLLVKHFNVNNASYVAEGNQQFDLSMQLENHPVLQPFLPDSLSFEPLDVQLSYTSKGRQVALQAAVPSVQYGQLLIREPVLRLNTMGGALHYELALNEVKQGELEAPPLELTGKLLNDVADFSLLLRDTINNEDNRVSGNINIAALKAGGELPPMNVDLTIDRLALRSFEAFATEYITDTEGYFSGTVQIEDVMGEMGITGALKFNDIAMKILMLDETFRMPTDELLLTKNALLFDQFDILDEKGEKLTVDGQVGFVNFADFSFDLSVMTDNFRALSSASGSNELFYGDLLMGVDLKIKGTIDLPVVTGKLTINDKSRLTLMVPQSDPTLTDRTGIVEFVTPGQPSTANEVVLADSLRQSNINGMDVSVDIEVDKGAELTMIIDKATGDFVKMKGEALLSGGIDPSGKISLTGRYEFNEGIYEMNVSLIQRKFAIRKGSYIQWTGEPLSALLNITAYHETKTAPLSLVESRLAGASPEMRNRYLQRLPFETELKVTGELMKPEIVFDIVLVDDAQQVSADVLSTTKAQLVQLRSDPAELYKQVFSLLMFNQFMAENPMSSSSGGSTGLMIRESAGRIISQQLNQLAGNLIKGVEVDFDVNATDDYSTGVRESRTNLNVALSKQLFDNRLKITVGSSFGLEGTPSENQSSSNIAGNFSADYLITRDGRYKLRAYRKNEYQVALLGEIVETGLTFIITMDYDTWKDLSAKK